MVQGRAASTHAIDDRELIFTGVFDAEANEPHS